METILPKPTWTAFRQHPLQMIPFTPFKDVPEDDQTEEKPFLQCLYNYSDKGYRSPWTNRWYVFTKASDGGQDIDIYERPIPPAEQELRRIEYAANEVWDAYTQLYYGKDAIGNAFFKKGSKGSLWEGIFGVHKHCKKEGSWDTVHVVQLKPNGDQSCDYRVDSAALVVLRTDDKHSSVSASLTKETLKTCKLRSSALISSHLENLGSIMEDVEMEFRSRLERVDIPKAIDVMQAVYRKKPPTASNGEAPSMATGMGVGSGMINEIATMAKNKNLGGDGDANPIVEALKKNQNARHQAQGESPTHKTEGAYEDMKKTLKKGSSPKSAIPTETSKPDAGNEYSNLKAGLKKSNNPSNTKPETAPMSPTPELKSIKLKKTTSAPPAKPESAPTPLSPMAQLKNIYS